MKKITKNTPAILFAGIFIIILYVFLVGFSYPQENEWRIDGEFSLISSFTTKFELSPTERKHNIKLAAKALDKKVIFPNEEFSFNDVVGARTKEKGYKEAKVIFNSEYVDGVGGGICQVSTTLYNAVLKGNLTVTESHPHTLSASYVLPSFDAMVSFGVFDLRFINESNGIVMIRAYANDREITVNIFAKKLPKGMEIKRFSRVIKHIAPPPDKILGDEKLIAKEGEILKENYIVYPKKGMIAESYKEIYSFGVLKKRVFLRKDRYAPIQGIKEVTVEKANIGETLH